MPCTLQPSLPPLPTLPSPFTLGVTLPVISFDPTLCCKLLPAPVTIPHPPLPPLIFNSALAVAINAGLAVIVAYTRALALRIECPRE